MFLIPRFVRILIFWEMLLVTRKGVPGSLGSTSFGSANREENFCSVGVGAARAIHLKCNNMNMIEWEYKVTV